MGGGGDGTRDDCFNWLRSALSLLLSARATEWCNVAPGESEGHLCVEEAASTRSECSNTSVLGSLVNLTCV